MSSTNTHFVSELTAARDLRGIAPHDHEQAGDAYGSNCTRLRALKRRFDQDGVFASAIPLPDEH